MPFSISFLDEEPFREKGMDPAARGLLSVGEWKEEFYSSLFIWTPAQYEEQWRNAIEVLLNGGTKSALITEYLTPDVSTHLVWWPMYREGPTVRLQNHLLFFDQLEMPFSAKALYASLRDRELVSETGEPISEWSCDVDDLARFRWGVRP
jgi:hypothetical protein